MFSLIGFGFVSCSSVKLVLSLKYKKWVRIGIFLQEVSCQCSVELRKDKSTVYC